MEKGFKFSVFFLIFFSQFFFASESKKRIEQARDFSKFTKWGNEDYFSSDESDEEALFGVFLEVQSKKNSSVVKPLDVSLCKNYDENDPTLPPTLQRNSSRQAWLDAKSLKLQETGTLQAEVKDEGSKKDGEIIDLSQLDLEDFSSENS